MKSKLEQIIPEGHIQYAASRFSSCEKAYQDLPTEDLACYFIALSNLFDTNYYLSEYSDVDGYGMDPIHHYVRYGTYENRNPAPWFNSKLYLDENWDVKREGINPFYHYIRYGFQEGRRANASEKKKRDRLIVSLTSFPARIKTTHLCVQTLLAQSMPADEVVLWLAYEEFPAKELDLPHELLVLCQKGLTIKWCYNLKSYKKLIPALKEYPYDVIVTADDDVYYEKDWLELLYKSYLKDHECIHCHRSHRVLFNKDMSIKKYADWKFCIDSSEKLYVNFFTGVGGVLYPSKCFYNDILDETLFMDIAPYGDDIWFWAMSVLQGTKCIVVENCHNKIKSIKIENDQNLWEENVIRGRNDEQIKKILERYPQILNKLIEEYGVHYN